ncbi:MAG TPA: metalloregulator ArsR/SmtB family transcription factor [Acetobacteraceae bacterium]|nr:metalloregulator ArsR/SmtB family transcription factor [Acetobacteraceae bacterium]
MIELPERVFKALADPARLCIVAALARPEAICCSPEDRVSAGDLERLVGLAQPSVSHHMRILTESGLVEAKKSGKFVYYRLKRASFHKLGAWLASLAGDPAKGPYPVLAEDEAA